MQHCKPWFLAIALCITGAASADASLHTRLGLDTEQSRQLVVIEASYRREFAALRQLHNREARALRRAQLAYDSAETARLDAVTRDLRARLKAMREAQDARIVSLLKEEQLARFEAYVAERRQMVGSSRDERLFE